MPYVKVDAVRRQVAALFVAVGVPPQDADSTAGLLVESECRGVTTHGLTRVESYLNLLVAGRVNPRPKMRLALMTPAVYHLSADNGLGQVAGLKAIDAAQDLARQYGVGVCLVDDCGHMGALGVYVNRVAEAGMMGWLVQTTTATMTPLGGQRPAIGNNPWAFGCPVPHESPLVFDMSCSVAARGHVLLAAERGESIPLGWAVDRQGKPTVDPHQALEGSMLPLGGHKGLGLAMIVQSLAGVLPGAPLRPRTSTEGALPEVGAFLLVLDSARLVGGPNVLEDRVTQWISTFRELATPSSRLPGERGARLMETCREHGLLLSEVRLSTFKRLCDTYKTPYTLTG